jgi:5S rRNA maturation endonuclease (ribonuclease M5)
LNPNSFKTINFKSLTEKIIESEKKANYYIYLYKNLKKNAILTEDIRGISEKLLNYLRKQNKLKYYKTDQYQTIKIPLYSETNEICGIQDIFKKTNSEKWEKRIHGHAGIFFVGNLVKIKSIIITESLFDSLSALQIHFNYNREKNLSYTFSNLLNELGSISINGSLSDLKRKALIDVIKNAKNLHTIVIAFDADQIGQKYKKEFIELLQSKNILNNYKILILNNYQGYKDFNEYLQAKIESGKIKQVS